MSKRVVIIGGGFAGLNCAKTLANSSEAKNLEIIVLDRRNHYLFQPLLYQVAMAGLSPAEIAAPIRKLLAENPNITVYQTTVHTIDPIRKVLSSSMGELEFDYLVMATGAKHSYFGKKDWENHAPGLKTLAQATEIRRRVLQAFEDAETTQDREKRKKLLTFVVIGGGPTGVELAGALGEMTRFTLAKDFRNINPKLARIILIEGSKRILAGFSLTSSARATRDLEQLGVQVWTESLVTDIQAEGVTIGSEFLAAQTVLWAAGVKASSLGQSEHWKTDEVGRIYVEKDLSIPNFPFIFAAGDIVHFKGKDNKPLPGMAPAAMQQGRWIARLIIADEKKETRKPFKYIDKGQMATIGRSRAVLESGSLNLSGFIAWLAWLVVHIYYLAGFRNRFFVVLQWAWSYLSFTRGARLIVNKEWRLSDSDN